MGLLEQIESAGVIGCGGAGFPTHIKYQTDQVEYLLLNGLECEPLLGTDRYLMIHYGEQIVQAAVAVGGMLGAAHVCIALKHEYVSEGQALEDAIKRQHAAVSLHRMESFYPAGDEQTIVYEVTGRVVPAGGIPLDVGCVVSNVATMLCIWESMNGKPFTHKYLTVTGLVKQPCIVRVPLGTSFRECIQLAGGSVGENCVVIAGGPAMGIRMTAGEADKSVVTKTTSGIILISNDSKIATVKRVKWEHIVNRAKSACIQCNQCTQMCPRFLLGHPIMPHKIMGKLAYGGDLSDMTDDVDIRNAALCCECGVCELYACPMGMMPRQVNSAVKSLLRQKGIRYQKKDEVYAADEYRFQRKTPSKRLAARMELSPFYAYNVEQLAEGNPRQVKIPLNMHIGMPATALVAVGDNVHCGQLIGDIPAGKLGAKVHASINGTVVSVDNSIVIERSEVEL